MDKPTNKQLARGIELLAQHLAATPFNASELQPLFADLVITPAAPNMVEFDGYPSDPEQANTLSCVLAVHFTTHNARPMSDIIGDADWPWPTPWIKEQTSLALLLIALSMHEFLVNR